jgi:hypothetical protein
VVRDPQAGQRAGDEFCGCRSGELAEVLQQVRGQRVVDLLGGREKWADAIRSV